jgi:hypothetical protein
LQWWFQRSNNFIHLVAGLGPHPDLEHWIRSPTFYVAFSHHQIDEKKSVHAIMLVAIG